MQKDEVALCNRFAAYDALEFVFDVQFYNYQTFLATYQVRPRQVGQAIYSVYGEFNKRLDQYCVVVRFARYFNETLDAAGVAIFLTTWQLLTAKLVVSRYQPRYCYECNGGCADTNDQAIINLGGDHLAAYVSDNRNVDYAAVKIVSFVVGMTIVVASLAIAIAGFYQIMQAIKMQRRQRKAQKTE